MDTLALPSSFRQTSGSENLIEEGRPSKSAKPDYWMANIRNRTISLLKPVVNACGLTLRPGFLFSSASRGQLLTLIGGVRIFASIADLAPPGAARLTSSEGACRDSRPYGQESFRAVKLHLCFSRHLSGRRFISHNLIAETSGDMLRQYQPSRSAPRIEIPSLNDRNSQRLYAQESAQPGYPKLPFLPLWHCKIRDISNASARLLRS